MTASRWLRRSCLAAGLALGVPGPSLAEAVDSDELHASRGKPVADRALRSGERDLDGLAGGFIQAFNVGGAALRRFESENRAARWLAPEFFDARLSHYGVQREILGTLDVHQVVPMGPNAVALLARAELTGGWVSVSLIAEPSDRGRLSLARIDQAVV